MDRMKHLQLAGKSWKHNWSGLLERILPACHRAECKYERSVLSHIWRRPRGIHLQGAWYCRPACLERALVEELRQLQPARASSPPAVHRVPLGLLLLSRQQLTAEQLVAALNAQRNAGCGRLGEWLQTLGFANEAQITAALARQWSCPLLRDPDALPAKTLPEIPSRLLESFHMLPVNYVEATATLHIAFSDAIDYSLLYAIERMLDCHTEPCFVSPGWLQKNLRIPFVDRTSCEVVFDRVADNHESARIIRSYAMKLDVPEVRMVVCGRYIWVRLKPAFRAAVDLLLSSVSDPAPNLFHFSEQP